MADNRARVRGDLEGPLQSTPPPVHAEKVNAPIPIGIGVAQTSNVALFGQEQVSGAKIAEKLFNAKGVNGAP